MQLSAKDLREYVAIGGVHGMAAWAAYGVVECIFSSVWPNLFGAKTGYSLLHGGFTILLFGLYMTFGAFLGALGGAAFLLASIRLSLLRRLDAARVLAPLSSSTVIVALVVNSLVSGSPQGWTLLGFLAIALALTAGLALTASSDTWNRRLRPILNSWTVSAILLGVLWVGTRFESRILKGSASAAWLVSVVMVSALSAVIARRLRPRLGHLLEKRPSGIVTLLGVAVTLVLFLPFSFWANRPPGLTAGALRGSQQDGKLPNILLITLDTLRADHMSVYGYSRDTTPNIEQFARNATLYTRAVSAGDLTLTSHASILTGTYALKHGVYFDPPDHPWGRHLPDRYRSLPEILAERGYATAAVVANYAWLGTKASLDRGFQHHDSRRRVTFLHAPHRTFFLRHLLGPTLHHRVRLPREWIEPNYHRAEVINRKVFRLLDRFHREQALFFLFINYLDPHTPYFPVRPFDRRYEGKIDGFDTKQYELLKRQILYQERTVDEEDRANLISQYDGEIAYLDSHFGELIQRLKQLGLYDNMLILVTSDHGEAFGERQILEHGFSVYQDQIDIPLIVKYPHQSQPATVDELVSHVDLLPTILVSAESPLPLYLDGRNLQEIESRGARAVVSESFPTWFDTATSRFVRQERAIFQDGLKFIWSSKGKRELYDLSSDPKEENELGVIEAEKADELESLLDSWMEIMKAEAGEQVDDPPALDEATRDALRSLGYIQ